MTREMTDSERRALRRDQRIVENAADAMRRILKRFENDPGAQLDSLTEFVTDVQPLVLLYQSWELEMQKRLIAQTSINDERDAWLIEMDAHDDDPAR